jgi:hypothetical protein
LGRLEAPHAETIDMLDLSIRVKVDLRQLCELLLAIWFFLSQ